MKKYSVLNPETGTYEEALSIEDAKLTIAKRAYAFYLWHTHNNPLAEVTVDDDGIEHWNNGSDLITEEELLKLIAKNIDA